MLFIALPQVARLNIENSELRTELDHSKQEVLSVNAAMEQNKLKASQCVPA